MANRFRASGNNFALATHTPLLLYPTVFIQLPDFIFYNKFITLYSAYGSILGFSFALRILIIFPSPMDVRNPC
jgi:hypothetical protein